MLYYLRGAAKHSLSHSAVESDLKALSKQNAIYRVCFSFSTAVEAGAAAAVAQAWRKQVGAVTEFTADSALDVNKIVDMEWKFGVTVASDEVEQVRELCCPVRVGFTPARSEARFCNSSCSSTMVEKLKTFLWS